MIRVSVTRCRDLPADFATSDELLSVSILLPPRLSGTWKRLPGVETVRPAIPIDDSRARVTVRETVNSFIILNPLE